MITRVPVGARPAAIAEAPPRPIEDARPMRERNYDRSCIWRLALGALGLFWVCVLILLMS